MKNSGPSVSDTFKPVGKIFRKYHLTIFIVFITAGLVYAVFTFTQLFSDATTDTGYTSPINAGSIDQATLERIQALHTSDEPTPALITPAGRTNPFSE